MTINPVIVSKLQSLQAPNRAPQEQQAQVASAARQFEGILLQQLLRVLRATASSSTEGSGEENYTDMFDGQLADQLSEAGGIGIAQELESAFAPNQSGAHTVRSGRISALKYTQPTSLASISATTGDALMGQTSALQRAADQLLRAGTEQWSKKGTLSTADLQSQFATNDSQGNRATFEVREALGYQGYNKCNLFALELARRAGFKVPVIDRGQGWGYPSSNGVTKDAVGDGKLRGQWATVVGNESAQQLDSAIVRGGRAFMLTGSGRENAQGHMAVVERIREIQYGPDQTISRIVFDGWEARPQAGAEHLVQRSWNVGAGSGGHLVRSGFDRIHILELQPAASTAAAEVPL